MEHLSTILWREREMLETLLFHLEVEQLVLSSGRSRWLARSANEVEAVLARLRETEILRSVAADEAAAAVGLGPRSSLRDLAEAVDDPWHSILFDHRDAFLTVSREISALAETNRVLLTVGLRSARETLMTLGGQDVQGCAPDGAVVLGGRSHLVDRSL